MLCSSLTSPIEVNVQRKAPGRRWRARWRRALFGIKPDEASFERRGFTGARPVTRECLERIGEVFIAGYGAALDLDDLDELVATLNQVDAELRGFAFEGAAMALAIRDWVPVGGLSRSRRFLQKAESHTYMVHVGIGWAMARLGKSERALAELDPVLKWLALDGYGFHEGYFRWSRYRGGTRPRGLSGYALRAFDQGLGRSLWFVHGGDVERIPAAIMALSPDRAGDLWSGVGLACAYAGGVTEQDLVLLRRAGEDAGRRAELGQGAAFAAKARLRAGNPATHTELACQVLTDLCASDAAGVTDAELALASGSADEPQYEDWRRRIQGRFGGQERFNVAS